MDKTTPAQGKTTKRLLKIIIPVLFLAVAGWAYTSFSKKITPKPTPQDLIALENALAGPDLIGLFYLDMDYMLRLEKAFMGEDDAFALPTSTGTEDKVDDSLFSFLRQSGLRVDESVDYVVGGFIAREKDAGKVQVALGRFPMDTLIRNWEKNPDVKKTEINGRTAWLWTPIDIDTCKPSPSEVLIAEGNRLITGDPETVAWFLKRMDQVKAQQDLSYWRNYRKEKLFSFVVFLPKNLKDIPQNMWVRMLASAAQDKMVPVTGLYGGGQVTWIPAGLDIELLLESTDSAWNHEWHQELQKWKQKTVDDIEEDFKSLKKLVSYLDSEATDEKLILKAKVNEALVEDIGKVVQEGIDWFASSLSSSVSVSGTGDRSKERIIPAKDIEPYNDAPEPDDLDPFDSTAATSEIYSTTNGPFGVRIQSISLNPKEKGVVDLKIEAVSSHIPELEIDPRAKAGQGTGGWIRITHVFDKKGQELLSNKDCGEDRNSKYVTMTQGNRTARSSKMKITPTIQKLIDKENEGRDPKWSFMDFIHMNVLKGSKTAHLKPGARMTDIEVIEGEIILQLPAEITKERIHAPFKDQVIQEDGIRIKLKESNSNTINYQASGEVGRIIKVRALNNSGQYLQRSSSMTSGLGFGRGFNKSQNFYGEPKTVEFVLASELEQETYPFRFAFQLPTKPADQFFQLIEVETQSKKEFLKQKYGDVLKKVCSRDESEFRSEPFYICLSQRLSLRDAWQQTGKRVSARVMVHAREMPAVTGNLSAVQMLIEKTIIKNSTFSKRKIFSTKYETFLNLDAKLWNTHSLGLKGTYHDFVTDPIDLDDEHMTPVGFEGYLKIRLPRKLDSVRLDLFDLGHTVKAPNGLIAKFTRIHENAFHLQIEGPRETLVQFLPRDASGNALKQRSVVIARDLKKKDKEVWKAEVQMPPETRYLDVVYALKQDIFKIPFHIEKKPPSS